VAVDENELRRRLAGEGGAVLVFDRERGELVRPGTPGEPTPR
jgi:hypothetical protein